jgi:hypothetical protein
MSRCPRRRWIGRRRDLVERLRPYQQPPSAPLDSLVSTEPLRLFFCGWIAATGDRVDVAARGFDLSLELLEDILGGQIRRIRIDDALAVCDAIRVEPDELWRRQL